jgi:hypothetical protein
MNKVNIAPYKFYSFGIALLLVICLGFKIAVKQSKAIILQDEKLNITPKEFYVADVIDERADRTAVAWLINSKEDKATPVDLQGGSIHAVKQFITHNLAKNSILLPIVIKLKKFAVIETALAGGRIEGRVTLSTSFYLKKDSDLVYLADDNGYATYNRNISQDKNIEPLLRTLLKNNLLYLNAWMDKQAGSNIKLARGLKLSFSEYKEQTEGDSIYYSVKRPLTWADFQSKVGDSRFDAEVFPTIGYEEHNDIKNGIINVDLTLKVCLPKSANWVKEGSETAYALNHEQRHFDIAKIAAERFRKKLLAESLPVDNYDGPVNVDYLDAYRDMNAMQKQYDSETRHGSDHLAQEQWNKRIDKELKELGVIVRD